MLEAHISRFEVYSDWVGKFPRSFPTVMTFFPTHPDPSGDSMFTKTYHYCGSGHRSPSWMRVYEMRPEAT